MWVPKREYLSMKKMVESHEKDLREQLKTNCNMRGAIQNILESRKKDTHDYSRMSEKEIEYRSVPNEVRQAVAWALSVENERRLKEKNMSEPLHVEAQEKPDTSLVAEVEATVKSVCKIIQERNMSNGEYADTVKALAALVEARAFLS